MVQRSENIVSKSFAHSFLTGSSVIASSASLLVIYADINIADCTRSPTHCFCIKSTKVDLKQFQRMSHDKA